MALGPVVCHPAIIGDSSATPSDGKRFVVRADKRLTAFLELKSAIQRDISAGANRIKATGAAAVSGETWASD
jgi:hypothetical protein